MLTFLIRHRTSGVLWAWKPAQLTFIGPLGAASSRTWTYLDPSEVDISSFTIVGYAA